jgi:hypothetical protein
LAEKDSAFCIRDSVHGWIQLHSGRRTISIPAFKSRASSVTKNTSAEEIAEKVAKLVPRQHDAGKALVTQAPISHPFVESPLIKEEEAKQMVRLADDLWEFAKDQRAIEDQIPPDPGLPLGVGKHKYDNNPTARQWEQYHLQTKGRFMRGGKEPYMARCQRIIDTLPADLPSADIEDLKRGCQDPPTDAKGLKSLSSLLSKMAQEVEHTISK